jgi:hypothetical protein
MTTYTHTYATMQVSRGTFEEVKAKLVAAGYEHAIHPPGEEDGTLLDMHGIALTTELGSIKGYVFTEARVRAFMATMQEHGFLYGYDAAENVLLGMHLAINHGLKLPE